mgnify:CR=1 FL=1
MKIPVIYFSLTDKKIKKLPNALFSANSVDVSGDYTTMAIGYENSKVAAYQLPELNEIWQEDINSSASELKYHPGNKILAAASSSGEIIIYNSSGTAIDRWQAVSGGVWKMQWLGDSLISGGSDGWIRSWMPNQSGAAWKKYRKADDFYWHKEELIGIDSNNIYNLKTGKQLASISNWASDKVQDASHYGILTIKSNRLHFYKSGTYALIAFPEVTDSLRVSASKVSEDGAIVVTSWRPISAYSPLMRGAVSIWNTIDNSVKWLDSIPDFPESIAILNNELLACSGSDAMCIWEIKTNKLISKTGGYSMKPIKKLAFLDRDQIVIGYLMGKIQVVSTKTQNKILYGSEIPTGSIYDLCVLKDNSIITIDVDGIRWFDKQLNYLGPLVNTKGSRSIISKVSVSDSNELLGLKVRSGEIETVSLNVLEIANLTQLKAKTMYKLDSSSE